MTSPRTILITGKKVLPVEVSQGEIINHQPSHCIQLWFKSKKDIEKIGEIIIK